MKNAKKILITTATREIFILRRGRWQEIPGFCEECAEETVMLDLNSAMTIFRFGARELIRQIETGAIHSTESAGRHLLICRKSLQAAM